MAHKFCFAAKSSDKNKTAVFHSADEEYRVNYDVNEVDDILISVEWLAPKEVLVTAELRNITDFKCVSSESEFSTDRQVSLTFHSILKSFDKICDFMIIINIIPFVELEDRSVLKAKAGQSSIGLDKSDKFLLDMLTGLALDMRDFWKSGHMCDVVLTNGSLDIDVHSIILSARSSVFSEMFKSPSQEKKITITGCSNEAFENMVEFIYSGFIKIKNVKLAEELYMLADKYDLEDLTEMSSRVLVANLTSDDALDTLILAMEYKDDYLKKSVVSFIIENIHIMEQKNLERFAQCDINMITEILGSVGDILRNKGLV